MSCLGPLRHLVKARSLLALTRPKLLDLVAINCSRSLNRRYANIATTAKTATDGQSTSDDSLLPPPKLLDEPITYGQPTPTTHPHLLLPGELVPGQSLQEFQERRQRVMSSLQMAAQLSTPSASAKNAKKPHFLVVPAATKKFVSGKTAYSFRQDSNFYYLTGCLEPDAVLLLSIDEHSNLRTLLFLRQKNELLEKMDGARTSPEEAVGMFGLNEGYELSQFENIFRTRVQQEKPLIWYDRSNAEFDLISKRLITIAQESKSNIRSPAFQLQDIRCKKTLAEQKLIRKSCQITSTAFNNVMQKSTVGMTENRLAAMVEYECRKFETQFLAFPPVVAAGNNTKTIHYNFNNQLINAGDLVLMDAGCYYFGYTSDITRTWPISGQFSKPQKLLYEVVLQVQKDLIETILKSGGGSLNALQNTMFDKLGKYLRELKIIPETITNEDQLAQACKQFCPHPVSHYLGLDLDDTELVSRDMKLKAGTVFTIAPGLYLGSDLKGVPEEFRGIGIRIADNILIDDDNKVEVLTASCAKEEKEIKLLMDKRKKEIV